jgi:hypothetical protein
LRLERKLLLLLMGDLRLKRRLIPAVSTINQVVSLFLRGLSDKYFTDWRWSWSIPLIS